ncbi:hypothetical protein DER46DRAFT_122230 [Fusarium sp. MPI-SDFR-AT-0072]|nr:hypothetical protein DER46DRAFT_122230 [Fusarium sp. MPI-SDFR-AT-0072]
MVRYWHLNTGLLHTWCFSRSLPTSTPSVRLSQSSPMIKFYEFSILYGKIKYSEQVCARMSGYDSKQLQQLFAKP